MSEDAYDSEQHSAFGFGVSIVTPEMIEKVKCDLADARAIGAEVFLTMPPFNPSPTCRKCAGTRVEVRYVFAGYPACAKHAGEHEHFHRTCKRCGFIWFERVLSEDP
jgi:hypothetical protein